MTIWRPASDFWSRKESDFSGWVQSHTRCGDATISNARLRSSNSTHVGDWLQASTLHSKLPPNRCMELFIALFNGIQLLTLYDVWFSHNTCVTYRRRQISHRTKDDLTVGKKFFIRLYGSSSSTQKQTKKTKNYTRNAMNSNKRWGRSSASVFTAVI